MNKLILGLLFFLGSVTGFSQKVYFVYLQADAGQPFFVKMDGKVHSSSASGYLILSKLRDTTYNISVGFPQDKWPEQRFTITVSRKDHGYLLKNFGEKGWGLFDLQTLVVQMSEGGSAKTGTRETIENKDVSVFAEMLSKASGDPSLMEKPASVKKEEPVIPENSLAGITGENKKDILEKKKDELTELPPAKKEDTAVVLLEEPVKNTEELTTAPETGVASLKPETPPAKVEKMATPAEEPFKPTLVTKRSESSTSEGFGLVFIDQTGKDSYDTIRLLIPNPERVVAIIKDAPRTEKRFIDMLPDTIKKKDELVSGVDTVGKENTGEKNAFRNNCPSIAEESDFFSLRKNMAAAEGDDNMLIEAKNYFKTKCFRTDQVKNLGLLFLNDEGKYKFFDLAYAYVTDQENFSALQNELKEDYYINRFRAMVHN